MAWVLGISVSHNGAACLMRDGTIIVAVQEERLSRRKRDLIAFSRRSLAVSYCLDFARLTPGDLDLVVVCSQAEAQPDSRSVLLDKQLNVGGNGTAVRFLGHHIGHLMSALALCGCDSFAGLVVDGMGSPVRALTAEEQAACKGDPMKDWECISLYDVSHGVVRPLEKLTVRDGAWLGAPQAGLRAYGSLGGMYAAVAETVFGDLSSAGQVMGLAPLGQPVIGASKFFEIRDGILHYRDLGTRLASTSPWPQDRLAHQDMAASVHLALEAALLYLASRLRSLTPHRQLCCAGGVALNAVANERLRREAGFEDIFVPAAAEDSGPALGAAYWGSRELGVDRPTCRISSDSLGRTYALEEIAAAARSTPGIATANLGRDIYRACAERLARGEVCGWFQGGSEFGPRALGQRSILADPRRPEMKDRLNLKVKHRQPFRPFAPAVLLEHAADWFEPAGPGDQSPFMVRVWSVKVDRRPAVPAIVHADGSARPQTVAKAETPALHRLLTAFQDLTGVPLLVNTSFNVNSEPIVETPTDALWCFLMTGIDFCVLEGALVEKTVGLQALASMCPLLSAAAGDALAHGDVLTPLSITSATPWGDRLSLLPGGARPLLGLIDGERSVSEIAHAHARQGVVSSSDPGLLHAFAKLYRAGAVSWRED